MNFGSFFFPFCLYFFLTGVLIGQTVNPAQKNEGAKKDLTNIPASGEGYALVLPQKFMVFFANGEYFNLQHINDYGDKANFWYAYQSRMDWFCSEVCKKGIPVKAIHVHDSITIEIKSPLEFQQWFSKNQPGIKPCQCFGNVLNNDSLYLKGKMHFLRIDTFLQAIKSRGGFRQVDGYTSRNFTALFRMVNEGLASIEKIEQGENPALNAALITKLKQGFSIPKSKVVDGYDLIGYLNAYIKDTTGATLNALCEANLKLIQEALAELDTTYFQLKNKK